MNLLNLLYYKSEALSYTYFGGSLNYFKCQYLSIMIHILVLHLGYLLGYFKFYDFKFTIGMSVICLIIIEICYSKFGSYYLSDLYWQYFLISIFLGEMCVVTCWPSSTWADGTVLNSDVGVEVFFYPRKVCYFIRESSVNFL